MASVHIVNIQLTNVAPNGDIVNKNTASVGQMLHTSTEHRIVEDSAIPNTAGNPTIKEFLELEAGDDFILNHIDQTKIITYGP